MVAKVRLHIYDVTNGSENIRKRTIVSINNVLFGLGGIFHTAVQVYGEGEWSYGFCSGGESGVFRCPVGKNTMFKYRTSLVVGETNLNFFQVIQILSELGREWPGDSYDPLSKNCNHFSQQFCARLGVTKLPAWINRFANTAHLAREGLQNIVSASKDAYRFLFADNVTNTNNVNVKSTGLDEYSNRLGRSLRIQPALFKNLSSKSYRCLSSRKLGELG